MLNLQDIELLRALARDYAELAALPEQSNRRARWVRKNDLKSERPLITIHQVCWNEMDVDGTLRARVSDPYWASVESELRRTLYRWKHMPVDMVINPYVTLARPILNTGWGLERVLDTLSSDATSDVLSQHYANQIQEPEDIERLQFPEISLDTAREQEIRAEADQVFGGIIPYRMTGECLHLGLWDWISQRMGVENCYIELMDRPEMMHALMEKMTEGTIRQIEQMNALNLFDVNSNICHCSYIFSELLPRKDLDFEHPTSHDAWAFGLAQLFTAVAPSITEEFEVAYMKRVFPLFGAIYYGCCERLDDRLDVLAKLPNVRKISCSPWSDKNRFAQRLPAGIIMSNKPSPALLATSTFDEDAARRDLRETISAARRYDRPLEFLLKDISTVRYDPARLWRWAEIAVQEAENA